MSNENSGSLPIRNPLNNRPKQGLPTSMQRPSNSGIPTQPKTPNGRTPLGHGGKPRKNVTAATKTEYESVGVLTLNDLLYGHRDQYKHLDDKIVLAKNWVQEYFKNNKMSEDIAAARSDHSLREAMKIELDRALFQYMSVSNDMPRGNDRNIIIASVVNEILGLGPIEPLWSDDKITEVMVNGPDNVYVEMDGNLVFVPGCRFRDREHLTDVCAQILAPLNRRVDQKTPLTDGRLVDGSRVNVVHHSIAPGGPLLTIRKHPAIVWTMEDLVKKGSISEDMATTLSWLVYHKCSTIVIGGTGSGKALDVNTKIPTPDGFKTMGELQVGDKVFDENGESCNVTAVYDQPSGRECYKVVFDDGSHLIADGEHNWFASREGEYDEEGDVITTSQIVSQMDKGSKYMIRNTAAVSYGTKKQPYNPYVVGLYLGKKNIVDDNGDITVSSLQENAAVIEHNLVDDSQKWDTWVKTREIFDADGELTIPPVYMFADITQRYALLKGLIDGCGKKDFESDRVFLSFDDEKLASDVRSLVASLGFKVFRGKSSLVDDDSVSVNVISFDASVLAWLSSSDSITDRKHNSVDVKKKNFRSIVSVVKVDSVEVKCITVDSANSLYLAGEQYVPTHNTSLLNALSSCIPVGERIITIEDSMELRMHPKAHVGAMEARPASASGEGAVPIRRLVVNALRQRPDRIIVGECRDASALDMLTAMNTGHEGSLTTVHANDAETAVSRLSTMVAMGGDIPDDKVSWLIGEAVDLFVVQRRYEDGSRRVAGIYEVPSLNQTPNSRLLPIPLWEWEQDGVDEKGKFYGHYKKKNDLSEHLVRSRRLDKFEPFTYEDVKKLSELPSDMKMKH